MKIFTGKASRAEVYGAIMVVSVLFAGGIGGAAVIASDTTSHITADTSTTTTSTDTQSVIKSDNTSSSTTTEISNSGSGGYGGGPPSTETTIPVAPTPATFPTPKDITVPNFVGMDGQDASSYFFSLGFKGSFVYDQGPDGNSGMACGTGKPPWSVVWQSPAPGTVIDAHGTITWQRAGTEGAGGFCPN